MYGLIIALLVVGMAARASASSKSEGAIRFIPDPTPTQPTEPNQPTTPIGRDPQGETDTGRDTGKTPSRDVDTSQDKGTVESAQDESTPPKTSPGLREKDLPFSTVDEISILKMDIPLENLGSLPKTGGLYSTALPWLLIVFGSLCLLWQAQGKKEKDPEYPNRYSKGKMTLPAARLRGILRDTALRGGGD